jgi:hypothetical protein
MMLRENQQESAPAQPLTESYGRRVLHKTRGYCTTQPKLSSVATFNAQSYQGLMMRTWQCSDFLLFYLQNIIILL